MRLLHVGVDPSTIALWLGHEGAETTQIYVHADQTIKERALARTAPLAPRLDAIDLRTHSSGSSNSSAEASNHAEEVPLAMLPTRSLVKSSA